MMEDMASSKRITELRFVMDPTSGLALVGLDIVNTYALFDLCNNNAILLFQIQLFNAYVTYHSPASVHYSNFMTFYYGIVSFALFYIIMQSNLLCTLSLYPIDVDWSREEKTQLIHYCFVFDAVPG